MPTHTRNEYLRQYFIWVLSSTYNKLENKLIIWVVFSPIKGLAEAKLFYWLWCRVFRKSSLLLCPHSICSSAGIRPSPPPSNKYRFQEQFIQISVMICLISQYNKDFGVRAFVVLTLRLYFKQNYCRFHKLLLLYLLFSWCCCLAVCTLFSYWNSSFHQSYISLFINTGHFSSGNSCSTHTEDDKNST